MSSFFKTKKHKKVENFIYAINAIPLFLLGELKDRFPNEIVWFMSPITINDDRTIKDIILSVAIVYGSITEGLPKKEEKSIRKELAKESDLFERYSEHFLNWLVEREKVYLSTNPNPSQLQYVEEFLYAAIGDYICIQVEAIHRSNDEKFRFTDEFTYEAGVLIVSCFNDVLNGRI